MTECSGNVPCRTCNGTGTVKCECLEHSLKTVDNHPLNTVDWNSGGSRQGYCVQQCRRCGRVWGCRYQFDPGTGSDNHYKDFGFGNPLELATERHY
jgi:hypothetical protein